MKVLFLKIRSFFKKWKDVFFDRTYLESLPKGLIACIRRSKRLMIYFAGVMLLGLIITAGPFTRLISCTGLCLLIELLLLVRFLTLKNDLIQSRYDIYIGKVVGSKSPWYIGGKLNRKREKQILLIEGLENGELIKCSLIGNVSADLTDGSIVKIYARETTEDDTGTLVITSYYSIVNPGRSEQERQKAIDRKV